MMVPLEREVGILNWLARRYYSVIPVEYRTFCSLTAEVSTRVLQHQGIPATVLPCQVWCSRPTGQHHVVGFVGSGSKTGKWDGHVVCAGSRFILDAALHHFQREFRLEVPDILLARRHRFSSQSIAVSTLPAGCTLSWLNAPQHSPALVPTSPEALVSELAQRLIAAMAEDAGGEEPKHQLED